MLLIWQLLLLLHATDMAAVDALRLLLLLLSTTAPLVVLLYPGLLVINALYVTRTTWYVRLVAKLFFTSIGTFHFNR